MRNLNKFFYRNYYVLKKFNKAVSLFAKEQNISTIQAKKIMIDFFLSHLPSEPINQEDKSDELLIIHENSFDFPEKTFSLTELKQKTITANSCPIIFKTLEL